MSEDSPNYVESLRKAMAQPVVEWIENVPVVLMPEGFSAKALPELAELDRPRAIRRETVASDLRGFIDYVNKYKRTETSLYAEAYVSPSLLAIIDDHDHTTPRHARHRVKFGCPLTHEWKQWTGMDKKPMGQVEFAEFIESNIKDIISPTGSELLESVLNFRDTGKAEFKSAIRLADGRVQFKFHQSDENGEVKFPEELGLALPVFEGFINDEGAVVGYSISAKLRYRIRDEALSIWFELQRPDLVMRKAYEDLILRVAQDTDIKLIRATPGHNSALTLPSFNTR